jgi:hypothetical protein
MISDPNQSVLQIRHKTRPEYTGTGFVIYRDENGTYFLTAAHVVSQIGADQLKVAHCDAKVVAHGSSEGFDIAVLMVEGGLLEKPTIELSCGHSDLSEIIITGCYRSAGSNVMDSLNGRIIRSIQLLDNNNQVTGWEFEIEEGRTLEGGYSGSPVLDRRDGTVIGVALHTRGDKATSGRAISVEALRYITNGASFD